MYACTYSVYTLVACDCMTDEKPLCESLWKEDRETERARGRFDEVEGVYLACTCSLWLSSHRGDREAVAPRGRSWPQIHHTHQLEKIISHSDSQAQRFSSTSKSGSEVVLKSGMSVNNSYANAKQLWQLRHDETCLFYDFLKHSCCTWTYHECFGHQTKHRSTEVYHQFKVHKRTWVC